MAKLVDIGTKIGKLFLKNIVGKTKHNKSIVECVCDCGTIKNITLNNIGHKTNSCGCFKVELIKSKALPKEEKARRRRESEKKAKRWRKESYKLKNKLYFQNNKEKIRKLNAKNYHNRIKNDANFRLKIALRRRFNTALKRKYKITSVINLIGCTIDELRKYIEVKFSEGMSWDNHGKWHIDHIIPLSSFDLTIFEQQQKAWHYTNLQPLWREHNLAKGSKILNEGINEY